MAYAVLEILLIHGMGVGFGACRAAWRHPRGYIERE